MSKSQSTPTIKDSILELLKDGEKQTAEIYEAVEGKKKSIDACLSRLVNAGEIVRVEHGLYRLNAVPTMPVAIENLRGEIENTETINKVLNLYDTVLDNIALTIEKELLLTATIEEKIDLIKSLRWLGATVDQLMKRWYLVHRGYDANTRQAQEDAKKKTTEREQSALETSPPEDQVVVVADYHERVRGIWDTLPESEKKKRTL